MKNRVMIVMMIIMLGLVFFPKEIKTVVRTLLLEKWDEEIND